MGYQGRGLSEQALAFSFGSPETSKGLETMRLRSGAKESRKRALVGEK